jgi:hypothetical protein
VASLTNRSWLPRSRTPSAQLTVSGNHSLRKFVTVEVGISREFFGEVVRDKFHVESGVRFDLRCLDFRLGVVVAEPGVEFVIRQGTVIVKATPFRLRSGSPCGCPESRKVRRQRRGKDNPSSLSQLQ